MFALLDTSQFYYNYLKKNDRNIDEYIVTQWIKHCILVTISIKHYTSWKCEYNTLLSRMQLKYYVSSYIECNAIYCNTVNITLYLSKNKCNDMFCHIVYEILYIVKKLMSHYVFSHS